MKRKESSDISSLSAFVWEIPVYFFKSYGSAYQIKLSMLVSWHGDRPTCTKYSISRESILIISQKDLHLTFLCVYTCDKNPTCQPHSLDLSQACDKSDSLGGGEST